MAFVDQEKIDRTAETAMAKDAAQKKAAAVGQQATDGAVDAEEAAEQETMGDKIQAAAATAREGVNNPFAGVQASGYEGVPKAGQYEPLDLFEVLPDVG